MNKERIKELLDNPEVREIIEEKRAEVLQTSTKSQSALDNVSIQQIAIPDCNDCEVVIDPITGLPVTVVECSTILPEGFSYEGGALLGPTFDPSCLQCEIEACMTTSNVTDPCGNIIDNCPVEIFIVRARGSLRILLGISVTNRPVCPNNTRGGVLGLECCECIDVALCYTCDPNACADIDFCNITVIPSAPIITPLPDGSNALTVPFIIFFPTC